MKKYNDFKWIPCDSLPWDARNCIGGGNSAEDLLALELAAIVALDLQHRGSSADVEEPAIARHACTLPIIQIE
jgi:hypothetical protein